MNEDQWGEGAGFIFFLKFELRAGVLGHRRARNRKI